MPDPTPTEALLDRLDALAARHLPLDYVNQGKLQPASGDREGPTWGEVAALVAVARAAQVAAAREKLSGSWYDEMDVLMGALAALDMLAHRTEAPRG